MTSDTNLPDDEIDIRALFNTLFHYKWVVLGITLIAMVAVFLYSKFSSPKQYTAQAQVIISKPLYTTNLETSIQGIPQIPEASVLRDLALDNELLWNVYSSVEVSGTLNKKVNFEQFKTKVAAKLTGTSKMSLVVSMSNPNTSASVVNVWADMFIAQINTLYSVNAKSLNLIDKEVLQARQKWDDAEQVLKQKLPDGVVDAQKIILDNKKSTFTTYLDTITRLDLIAKDAKSLQDRLAVWPDDSRVGMEYQLSLIGLYQRATGGLTGVQIQVAAPATDSLRSVAEAKASLKALIDSLGSQRTQLQANLDQLKQDITSAILAYESANYLYTQLTTERDLALNAYQALTAQQEEVRIDLAREDVAAKIVGHALPPEQPVSNRTLVKTLIAGVVAFALSCFGVLVVNWWMSPASTKPVH